MFHGCGGATGGAPAAALATPLLSRNMREMACFTSFTGALISFAAKSPEMSDQDIA